MIKQVKFTNSSLGKTLEKQRNALEEQGKKIEALEVLKPEENLELK